MSSNQRSWLLIELAELRENLRDTVGNDYARVVEDIERRLQDETKAEYVAGTLEVAGDPARLALIAACRQLVGAPSDMTGWPHFLSVPRQLVGNLREALYDAEHPERSSEKSGGES